MIVVDASVAVKWLIAEEGSDAARELLSGGELLVVPSPAQVEVPGAMLRKLRAGILDESETRGCLELWNDLLKESIRVVAFEAVLERAAKIAIACSQPLIDCIYVATAENCGAKLITADAALQTRCKRAFKGIALLSQVVAK